MEKRPRISPWIYVVILAGLLVANMYFLSQSDPNEIEYGRFLDSVRDGYVEELVVVDGAFIRGLYTPEAVDQGLVDPGEPSRTLFNENDESAKRRFVTVKPDDHELTQFLEDYNDAAIEQGLTPVKYGARRDDNWLTGLLTWVIPLGLIVILWLFLLRRMNPGQQVLNIGKNKAVLFDAMSDQRINFGDVAGLEEPKGEVEEIVQFPQESKTVYQTGWQAAEGRSACRPSWNRKDAAGSSSRRRGRCTLLLAVGKRLRRNVCRSWRSAGSRSVPAGQRKGALHHLH